MKSFTTLAAALLATLGNASAPQMRSNKRNGRGKAGAYGRGLRNAITAKNAAAMAQRPMLRDENGAYTLTGRPRRMWLAGISAQRNF